MTGPIHKFSPQIYARSFRRKTYRLKVLSKAISLAYYEHWKIARQKGCDNLLVWPA
jgi:hypothetical protein